MDGLADFLKQLGFGVPLIYATAAYGLFAWLDRKVSSDAKAALVATEQVPLV